MRLPRIQTSVPSLIVTIFVLSLLLMFPVAYREQARRRAAFEALQATRSWAFGETRAVARRRAALDAARAACQKARVAREDAEARLERASRWHWSSDATIQRIQSEVAHARADERARKADYDRLMEIRTGFFW
jgi:hypothetical protein